jgi:hypothetical protein
MMRARKVQDVARVDSFRVRDSDIIEFNYHDVAMQVSLAERKFKSIMAESKLHFDKAASSPEI